MQTRMRKRQVYESKAWSNCTDEWSMFTSPGLKSRSNNGMDLLSSRIILTFRFPNNELIGYLQLSVGVYGTLSYIRVQLFFSHY